MKIDDIVEYATNTPTNTNPAVLRSMLEDLQGGGSGDYMEKVARPHAGNLLITDSRGQAIDAGVNLSQKQDTLVDGENIATINGASITEGGNIHVVQGTFDTNNSKVELAQGNESLTVQQNSNGVRFIGQGAAGSQFINTDVPSMTYVNQFTTQSNMESYVTTYVENELANFDRLDYEIVTELPETGVAGKRYLVKHETDDRYEEYIYIEGTWYDVGATDEVNLDGYYTKVETDALLTGKQDVLVDGNNISTLNGTSLLGGGDVKVIQGDFKTQQGQVVLAQTDGSFTVTGETNSVHFAGVNSTGATYIDSRVPTMAYVEQFQSKSQVEKLIQDELEKFDKMDYQIVTELPETGTTGVRYLIKHATDDRYEEYIYVEGAWYDIGATDEVNLGGYYTKIETDLLLDEKQAKLTNESNIKSINGETLLGSGTINTVQGGYDSSNGQVLFTQDSNTLGIIQQTSGIRFVGIDKNGTQFIDRAVPSMETVSQYQTRAQVEALIESELANFDKLDYQIVTTLPATGAAGVRYLIKHATDDRYEEYIYVSNTWYDIGATDEVNLDMYYTKTDADMLLDGKQDILTFDDTPTEGSTNPVTSQGIKTYVDGRDPFMLLDFNTGTLTNFTVTSCTTATMPTGTSTGRLDINVPTNLQADWAIASLAKWEAVNANGTRVPIFPVFAFSMNGQITLRIGWKAAGPDSIAVTKISGAVLLKHR